jgi:hypothetical protein
MAFSHAALWHNSRAFPHPALSDSSLPHHALSVATASISLVLSGPHMLAGETVAHPALSDSDAEPHPALSDCDT